MAVGIDRADPFDTQAELDWLKCLKDTHAITFVGRYYKPANLPNYQLTKAEAQNISKLDLNLVAVFQGSGRSASDFSYDKGKSDCNRAIACAYDIGQPFDTGIYFAVDFDAYNTPGAMTNIREHFRGINDAMNFHQITEGKKWTIGIYAGRQVCEDIRSSGQVSLIWQAAGWRYGQDASNYNIKQTEVDKTVSCGASSYLLDWDAPRKSVV